MNLARLYACLSLLLALALGSVALAAHAESSVFLNLSVPTARAELALPNARTLIKPSLRHDEGEQHPQPGDALAGLRGSLASELARVDEMAGRFHLRMPLDEHWSGSLGSDYPKLRTPTYMLGNDAPGVPQRVWVQLGFQRRF